MRVFFIGSIPGHVPGANQPVLQQHAELFHASRSIGYEIGRRGWTLLIGSTSERTIDRYLLEGLANWARSEPEHPVTMELYRPEGDHASIHIYVPKNLRIIRKYHFNDPEHSHRWTVTHFSMAKECDCIVAMAGGGSTRRIGESALLHKYPHLLAVPQFGGSGEDLYRQMKRAYHTEYGVAAYTHVLEEPWSTNSAALMMNLVEAIVRGPHSSVSMSPLPADLINLLADEFPDDRTIRAIWQRAGGRPGQVEIQPKPRDTWQRLWTTSANGAVVTPERLLREILKDLPRNPLVLRQLRDIADPELAARAAIFVERIEQGPLSDQDTIDLLAEWKVTNPDKAFAAIAPAMEGRVAPEKRAWFGEMLQKISQGATGEVVKAISAGAVKAMIEAGIVATFVSAMAGT